MPIRNKADYWAYVKADRDNTYAPAVRGVRRWFRSDIERWTRLLRRLEYRLNCRRSRFDRPFNTFLRWRFNRLSRQMGFTIGPNVFGPGLSLPHRGTIVVNGMARVGRNCRLHVCVNIGDFKGGVPTIGDNVYIGPGAKLFGAITVGDNAVIGANAVVNRDVPGGMTVGGVPARVLSQQGSRELIPAHRKSPSGRRKTAADE